MQYHTQMVNVQPYKQELWNINQGINGASQMDYEAFKLKINYILLNDNQAFDEEDVQHYLICY